MFNIIIRFIFITFCSIYTYNKLLDLNISSRKLFALDILVSIILPTIIINTPYLESLLCLYLLFFFLFLYFLFSRQTKLTITFISSLISFLISYFSLSLVACIICAALTPFVNDYTLIQSPLIIFIGGIFQFLFIYLLFKKKRLHKGMPFLKYPKFTSAVLMTCSFAIIIFLGSQNIFFNMYSIRLFTLIFFLLLAIALLVWWRRKITQSYVEKLRVSEVESLYKEISDKDLEIEKLRVSNDQLAGIIHKDNKLIPAMELAVRNYLQTAALMKPEDAKQLGADLLANLERMSEDRTGIIRAYQENTSYRQRTGLSSIDAIVDYMENRASSLGIDYHYQYDKGIKEKLSAYISEDDAMHLLSDLIENAIIAASHSEKKVVHIHIGFIQDILFMDISDGGIPFKPETYQNLGMHQHTTHANDGGSGIGLMDLGKLKKQYKFSLQIYEYPIDESVHTKKIRILFDRKNHYLIQSYRAREIRSVVMRNDLHVFQYVDSENEIPILEDKTKRSV